MSVSVRMVCGIATLAAQRATIRLRTEGTLTVASQVSDNSRTALLHLSSVGSRVKTQYRFVWGNPENVIAFLGKPQLFRGE